MCCILWQKAVGRQVAPGADVTTLVAAFGIVGLNLNPSMSSRMAFPVAHKRTIAAGVIRKPHRHRWHRS
jgi:hypothetical protein